jgi:hypothetical protein
MSDQPVARELQHVIQLKLQLLWFASLSQNSDTKTRKLESANIQNPEFWNCYETASLYEKAFASILLSRFLHNGR